MLFAHIDCVLQPRVQGESIINLSISTVLLALRRRFFSGRSELGRCFEVQIGVVVATGRGERVRHHRHCTEDIVGEAILVSCM